MTLLYTQDAHVHNQCNQNDNVQSCLEKHLQMVDTRTNIMTLQVDCVSHVCIINKCNISMNNLSHIAL